MLPPRSWRQYQAQLVRRSRVIASRVGVRVAVVKPNRIMFEIAGVPEPVAREALRLASHKLPVPTKVVVRDELTI